MPNFPFYYKTKFHLITRDKENKLEFHNTEKEFSNPDPLKAREEAFEEFEEYLNFLKQNKKLEEDKRGNYKIISPTGLPQAPEIDEIENEEDLTNRIQALVEYMEGTEGLEEQ